MSYTEERKNKDKLAVYHTKFISDESRCRLYKEEKKRTLDDCVSERDTAFQNN